MRMKLRFTARLRADNPLNNKKKRKTLLRYVRKSVFLFGHLLFFIGEEAVFCL